MSKASDNPISVPKVPVDFQEEISQANLHRMWWLLVTSTSISVFFVFYNLAFMQNVDFAPWQVLDVGGSLIFLALIWMGNAGRLPRKVKYALSPAYFAFWLLLMDGYYFTALSKYGETATYTLGAITPAVLIILSPRYFLALLLGNHLIFCLLLESTGGRYFQTTEAYFSSFANGTLGVVIAIMAAWYLYSAKKSMFNKEQQIAQRTQEVRNAASNLRAILANIPFQAWLKDARGVFLAVNREFALNNGMNEDEIAGKSLTDLYGPDRAELYAREDREIVRTRESKFLEQEVEENGVHRWYEVFKSPVIADTGECLGTVGLARDITERKSMEAQLVAADTAKSEFLAIMSHEIRTPMNSVLGYARLLQDMPLNELEEEYVTAINNSGQILLTVINDILDFSKMEAGKIELQEEGVALQELLPRILEMFEPLAREKSLTLKLDLSQAVPAFVQVDVARLEQLLVNLLSNAVKFTDHGSVTLQVSALKSSAADKSWVLRLSVEDTGIGIAEEQLERLFKPFSQIDTAMARRYTGTGLGLVIVERLCKLMGGDIEVKSMPGRGSVFTATIRASEASNAEESIAPQSTQGDENISSCRMLVVEDNVANRRLVAAFLSRWGISATLAEGGIQALDALTQQDFDIILMDVQMPGMDGLEATRRIREMEAAQPSRKKLHIIALTAFARADDSARCLEAGMDDYLSKPMNPALLRSKIAQLLLCKKA